MASRPSDDPKSQRTKITHDRLVSHSFLISHFLTVSLSLPFSFCLEKMSESRSLGGVYTHPEGDSSESNARDHPACIVWVADVGCH